MRLKDLQLHCNFGVSMLDPQRDGGDVIFGVSSWQNPSDVDNNDLEDTVQKDKIMPTHVDIGYTEN